MSSTKSPHPATQPRPGARNHSSAASAAACTPAAAPKGRQAGARRGRDASAAPPTRRLRLSDSGSEATTRAAHAADDLRLLLPDGSTLLQLTEAQARVLDKCRDDDPALVFAWNPVALAALAAYLAAPGALVPLFGPLPPALNAAAIMERVVAYARHIPQGVQASFGDTVIAPLTLQDSYTVTHKLSHLSVDPAMIAYAASAGAVLPLAQLLFVHDGQRPARAVAAPVPPFPPGLGVQVFV